uniref:Transmembrane protein n=1 Tax=Peronospora matthiolae TaxID=2874970 RepID=A0AAV1UWD2_9STRA
MEAASRLSLDVIAAERTEAAAIAKRTRTSFSESIASLSGQALPERAAEGFQESSEVDEAWSARSNPSVSSYNSSMRERHRHAIASAFFGSNSTATETIVESPRAGIDRWRPRRRRSSYRTTERGRDGLLRRFFRPRRASESALTVGEIEAGGLQEEQHARTRRRQLSVPLDSMKGEEQEEKETREERWTRRENRLLFEDLVHLANTHQPVEFGRFKQRRSLRENSRVERSSKVSSAYLQRSSVAEELDVEGSCSFNSLEEKTDETYGDEVINTELLEAYIAYSKSIGHEPNFHLNSDMIPLQSQDMMENTVEYKDKEQQRVHRVSYIHDRPVLREHQHFWTGFLGTRYSKRRGCVQLWTWLLIGVGVLLWLGISLSSLEMNEVLHLGAFTFEDVQVLEDYTFLHFLERVDFDLTYTIQTPTSATRNSSATSNASFFNALLLTQEEYEHYIEGEPFEYIEAGTTLRTTYAYLSHTFIENTLEKTMYFVVQPCYLERNPRADYCQPAQLPTSVSSSEKIYNLKKRNTVEEQVDHERFSVTYLSANSIPVACSSSGWLGGSYLLLFLPYVVITLFGLRGFQMVVHCESWRKNLERNYSRELNMPENEVDYWQPVPWDRKVPKTRLCGPCCWKKFRRPLEPFHTWWRHENYFTWIFCPYRNEQLSRGERALIIVCSLYITFYVLFIIVMLRDSWGANMTIFRSVVLYAILISVLPPAGKAGFKELFKLIFRQRRKYFRAKAAGGGGDLKGFSFRFAFLLQFLVVLLLTVAQAPIFYIWAFRSCLFLRQFMWFGALASIMRMSLVALALDLIWYLIIQTWGWKDLCPYCTERIKHCDCFNDELLVLAVERVGPKWQLIRVLDDLMAKQCNYDPQFKLYTSEQLRERWDVLVERAKTHMEKMEKLRAYQEKKRLETLRFDRVRRSVTSFLSFRGAALLSHQSGSDIQEFTGDQENTRKSFNGASFASDEEEKCHENGAMDLQVCSLREKKVLELNNDIKLDKYEKQYDSNISSVFHALTCSVQNLRRHGKPPVTTRKERRRCGQGINEEEALSGSEDDEDEDGGSRAETARDSCSRRGIGETMWVFDTPAQRLKRREEEKLRRKRAFRVLDNYKIESVDTSMEPLALAKSSLSPIRSRHSSLSAVSNVPLSSTSLVSQRHHAMMQPLLIPSTQPPVSLPGETLVVLMLDNGQRNGREDRVDERVHLEERMVTGSGNDVYDDNKEDKNLSGVERGNQHSPLDHVAPVSRTYSVTERPQTLYRRLSASASAFTAWALNYDPSVEY